MKSISTERDHQDHHGVLSMGHTHTCTCTLPETDLTVFYPFSFVIAMEMPCFTCFAKTGERESHLASIQLIQPTIAMTYEDESGVMSRPPYRYYKWPRYPNEADTSTGEQCCPSKSLSVRGSAHECCHECPSARNRAKLCNYFWWFARPD